MPLKRPFLLLCALLCFATLPAQISTPLPACKKIELTFDESGKLVSPGGFALVEGEKYQLQITIDKPVKQQKAFWEAMAETCKVGLNRLKNPDDSLAIRWAAIDSTLNLDSLKAQLSTLDSILRLEEPKAAFAATKNSFSFFVNKKFLGEQLFGNIFTVHLQYIKDTTITVHADSNFVFKSVSFPCPKDSFVVTVRVATLQKQFLKNYYIEACKQLADTINNIQPSKFYKKDLPALFALRQRFDDFLKVVDALSTSNQVICDQHILDQYKDLTKYYTEFIKSNSLSKIIHSNWLGYWFWYSQGALKVNPLPFTDKERLLPKEGYDKEKSDIYDAYIESAIAKMENSLTLNETTTNYARMDSLLRQKGKGAERFSYAAEKKALIQDNNAQAKDLQAVKYTLHRVVFKAVPGKAAHAYLLRSYNADPQLVGSKDNFSMSVSTDTKVEAVVYNLKAGQTVALKETPVAIDDQSKIITDLNKAGDLFGGALVQANTAFIPFSNLLKAIHLQEKPEFDPIAISSEGSVGHSALSLRKSENNKRIGNYSLRIIQAEGSLKFGIFADEHLLNQSTNVLALVDRYLQDRNLFTCQPFVNEVHKKITKYLLKSQQTFPADEGVEFRVTDTLISISKGMAEIIESLYNEYALSSKSIYEDLTTKRNYLTLVVDFFGPAANHVLPPKEFKSQIDSLPRYSNQYQSFVKEQTAKRKDFDLTLTDLKTKKVTKLTDAFKTSPPRWLTASLGVAYVVHPFRRSEAAITSGVITNSPDEDQFRLITGLHYHVFSPIILTDDRSVFKLKTCRERFSRVSLFAGFSFPKPLYNPHLGLSVDIWPGVKLIGGVHFYRYTSYEILNNQIADQHSQYRYNKCFFSFSLEPVTFAKLIGLFK